jgi:hypothetical protein
VVSDVLVVFDIVELSAGTLAPAAFLIKEVKGMVLDAAVDAGVDYLKTTYGMRVEFKLTGWNIVCRLCGQRFRRERLSDGELLRCPRTGCKGEAYIHFQ